MRSRVECRLREIEQARQTDDQAVDFAEGVEAKHLRRVVGYSGVEQRTVEDEEGDGGVGGPEEGEETEETDGGGEGDEEAEDEGCGGVVEEEADEGDGEDAAEGEGDVEDVVDAGGESGRVQHILVLGVDGGDEVVEACHLQDGEDGDEDEPWGLDLLPCGQTVQSAPDS